MSTGESLIDKYKLLAPLATGQTTQVWEVTEANSPKRLAMKLLLPETFKVAANKSSLKYEFKAGKQFDHPNIIKFHEIVMAKKHAYFIMELFRAPNLKTQIKNDLTMVQVRIKRLIELMCLALEHIHEKGWLHRDVKPDNVLCNKGSEVKLIDFSLTSPISGALGRMFSKKGPIQGTRTYIAPEQILNKALTIQTDLYSLGVTIFEMLTGKPPFFGGTPKALLMAHLSETAPNPSFYNKNVTPEMDRIVSRLLSKKPDKRHKRAAEVWGELRTIDVFKEAVKELTAEEKASQKDAVDLSKLSAEDESRARLDSRLDHKRQDAIKLNPELGVQLEKMKAESKAKRAAETAAATKRVKSEDKSAGKTPPAPAWPAPQMGFPQLMPGMPMPMPGYPPIMPGYVMPPGYVPGMPYPMPPQPMMPPAMPVPGYTAPMPMMTPPGAPGVPGAPPAATQIGTAAPQPSAPASTPAPATAKTQPAAAAPASSPAKAAPSAPPTAKAPPKPAPVAPKPKPAAKPAPTAAAPSSDNGFDISALDGFDQLESTT
jgi:serine/threonine-protein kinase